MVGARHVDFSGGARETWWYVETKNLGYFCQCVTTEDGFWNCFYLISLFSHFSVVFARLFVHIFWCSIYSHQIYRATS